MARAGGAAYHQASCRKRIRRYAEENERGGRRLQQSSSRTANPAIHLTFSQSVEVARESLEELRRLAWTANAVVAGELVQHRRLPDGATYLGKGKVEELTELSRQTRADVIILDERRPGSRDLEKSPTARSLHR